MQILETREAIAERLKVLLMPIPVLIHPHADMSGKHLELALKNCYLSLHVAFLGNRRAGAEYDGSQLDAPLEWAVFITAKDGDRSGMRRDQLILGVLPTVMIEVSKNAELDEELETHAPHDIRSHPVFEGEVGGNSSMVWAVTWRQTSSLKPVPNDDLRPFLLLNTSYDLAPKDGVIDATDAIRMRVTDA